MSDKEKKQKLIPVRDFIYLCIILAIILIAVISYFLGDSSRAGENLNFAATAISVVLAVIAIIMTIVDSAGQKQNVFDLKKAIEVMQETLNEEKKIVEDFKEQLTAVDQNRTELMNEVKHFISFRDEITEIINKKNGDGSNQQAIDELKQKMDSFDLNKKYNSDLLTLNVVIDSEFEAKNEKIRRFTEYLTENGFKVVGSTVHKYRKIASIELRTSPKRQKELFLLIEAYQDKSITFISMG